MEASRKQLNIKLELNYFRYALYLKNEYILYGLSFFMGFFGLGLMPLSFDFGCEVSHPIGEALVTGIMNTGACLQGII